MMIDINISQLMMFLSQPFILGIILGALSLYIVMSFAFRRTNTLALAYHIGIVGFPQSGKTTLITSLFNDLFVEKILGIDVLPRGRETIERVNRDIERLQIGNTLGPTTDQDLFAYRADITRKVFPFKMKYKIEIGDFPGEDSTRFNEQFGDWFHETPFFKWVMESNAFIFVVDVAYILTDDINRSYNAKMTKAIRAAWQHILEYHVESGRSIHKKPLILVFSKADLLVRIKRSDMNLEDFNKMSKSLGFGDRFPELIHYKEVDILNSKKKIEDSFYDLINYLNGQSRRFSIVFTSHFAIGENGRMGIRDLLAKVLPGGF